jgi:hypothetical protein
MPIRSRVLALSALLLAVNAGFAQSQDKKLAITDVAKAGADYHLQGEYIGNMIVENRYWSAVGMQVIALGNGKFDAVIYQGGLPGNSWDGKTRHKLSGQQADGVLSLAGEGYAVRISGGVGVVRDAKSENCLGNLQRVIRSSCTLGARPTWGARVLFDGSNVEQFKNGRMTADGLLQSGTEYDTGSHDFKLHIEFRTPFMPHARGQGRANSGVYIHSRYEVQILDSFGLEGEHNEAGGLYRQRKPDLNMAFPPLTWQTYDIDFKAATFDEAGKKVTNARLTVRHNGVAIHDDVELTNKTGAGKQEGPSILPTKLQDHGNPVVFRNIWIVDPAKTSSHNCRCCCQ